MVTIIDEDRLFEDLTRSGIREGDVVYVRSRLSAVGRLRSKDALLQALRRCVGTEGTIVCPAFTSPGFRWSRKKKVFNAGAPSESGALTRLMLCDTESIRSKHPTHSFVGIGPSAKYLLGDHDHKQSAFSPIGKMIALKAKMLVIGCNKESPGFSTVHYAQEQLGLSQRHYTKFMYCVRLEIDGEVIEWYPREDPGCSRGFDKLYRDYLRAEILQTCWIGNAFSLVSRADLLYRVDNEILKKNSLATICDRPGCVSCRILRGYNLRAAPTALLNWVYQKAKNKMHLK